MKYDMSSEGPEYFGYPQGDLGEDFRAQVIDFADRRRSSLGELADVDGLEIRTLDVDGGQFVAPLGLYVLSETDTEGKEVEPGHLFASIVDRAKENKAVTAGVVVTVGAAITGLLVGIHYRKK